MSSASGQDHVLVYKIEFEVDVAMCTERAVQAMDTAIKAFGEQMVAKVQIVSASRSVQMSGTREEHHHSKGLFERTDIFGAGNESS